MGVVVRGCPPLCKFSRQSDSWWRSLSIGWAWRCAWCTGRSRSCSCCTDCAACSCVVEGRVNEEDEVLEVKGRWVNQGWDMEKTRWLDPFEAHKDDNAILEPCWPLSQARGVRSLLVNKLYCTDVYCKWVSCLHTPSIFWNSFQETEIATISQIM